MVRCNSSASSCRNALARRHQLSATGKEAPSLDLRRCVAIYRRLFPAGRLAQTYGAFRQLVRSGKVLLSVSGLMPADAEGIDLPIHCLNPVNARKAFAEADLAVLPSIGEITPAVILEARSLGVPLLAFAEAG